MTAARSYVGVSFRHAGRNRFGLDCAGLLVVVAHDLGLTDWDCVNYTRHVDCGFLRDCIERFCDRVEDHVPRAMREQYNCPLEMPGDVLLLSISGHAQHLAIYAGEGMMIHAHESVGRVVEHRFDRFWERRLEAVYRWRVELRLQ